MNIELLKKLEDVKLLRREIDVLLIPLIDDKREKFIQLIRDDFSKYFQDKGFAINTDKYFISATYGTLVASLSHDEPNDSFPSTEFMFDLDLETFNKKKYTIFIGVNSPSLKAVVKSSIKDADLQNQIDTIQKYIEESQIRITNFPKEVWKLFIKGKSASYGESGLKEYDSICTFLNYLFE